MILKEKTVDFLVGKRGDFFKSLCNKFDVTIKFHKSDRSTDFLSDDDRIPVLSYIIFIRLSAEN